jgi:hypothetical protein
MIKGQTSGRFPFFFPSQVAYTDSQSAAPTVQLANSFITNKQCVAFARSVLE